jgi:hypothetical protein
MAAVMAAAAGNPPFWRLAAFARPVAGLEPLRGVG